ncbi:MAG: hypothetical protein DRP45_11140, partial [Candidatus Zixiibacteriota bacterium]
MQSIENITLENWPVSSEENAKSRSVCHFAIKQTGVELDFRLQRYFSDRELSLHFFDTFSELVRICHRYPVNAIIIGGKSDFYKEIELVRSVKDNILLAIIPVILFHPEPDMTTVVAAYERGADEFIYGECVDRLVQVRIEQAIRRSERDLSVNPSTSLPGPATIEQEIHRQIKRGDCFAVCYADLDNFKPYNDYYGYAYGDRIIKLTGRILRDVVFDLCPEGFVGHIAGDDFICVVSPDVVHDVCKWIIKCFDAFVRYRYESVDLERGYIETENRKGEMERFPILSIS